MYKTDRWEGRKEGGGGRKVREEGWRVEEGGKWRINDKGGRRREEEGGGCRREESGEERMKEGEEGSKYMTCDLIKEVTGRKRSHNNVHS